MKGFHRKLGDPVYRFVYAVVAAAVAGTALAAARGDFAVFAHPRPALFAVIVATVIAESVAIRLPGHVDDMRFGGGTLTAYSALIMFGTGAAVVAFCVAVAFHNAIMERLAPVKTAFNTAQFAVTMLAAGSVLHLDPGVPSHGGYATIGVAHAWALAASAGALLAVNNGLSTYVTALAMGVRFRDNLRSCRPAMLVDGALIAYAPVVVIVAHAAAALLPVLLLPFVALYWSGRQADRRRHEAQHDALTGLPNRATFRARLHQELQRAERVGGRVDVLLLDLDGFKEINDALGHGLGDDVLRHVAGRLAQVRRPADVMARLGGDEFGAILVGLADDAALVAATERLRVALDEPVALGELRVRAGASIGVASWPEHGSDAEVLLRHADVAMYAAKTDRTGFAVYDRDRDPYSPERLELLGELREGIRRGELVLYFQPKLSLDTDRVEGVEALVRWQHPQRGLLPPAAFIELAEQSDLMGALTHRVLEDAVRQAAEWRTVGLDLSVAVNLSPDTLLDESLPATVQRLLDDASLSARHLQLEITESSLMRDAQRAASVLEGLRALGVRVSIDDFGTGYSSLAWLKRLPVHEIKIDRSFVMDLDEDESDAAIVESTVRLGQTLGLTVVAEGVETEAALERLRGFGCDSAQGYLISRPIPAGELTEWLAERARLAAADERRRALRAA